MAAILLAALLLLPASRAAASALDPLGTSITKLRLAGAQSEPVPAARIGASSEQISAFLQGLAKRMDLSKAHISVIDLRAPADPGRGGWNDLDIVPAASVIKLALLAEAHHAVASGARSWDSSIAISPRNMTGTWGPPHDPYPAITAGSLWSLRDLVEVMVRRSDNAATNTLIDVLGRSSATEFAHRNGLLLTYVRHKLSSGTDVPDPDATGYNQMPPRDAALLLEAAALGKLVSPEASGAMLKTLEGQLDRYLIASVLPPGTVYAGKTGQLSQNRNDAALVRGQGRFYVLAVYTSLPDNDEGTGPGGRKIQAIAREVDAFLSR
ncbi:MAG: class A beta-lactamase-related serine hydrolase [Elusimicrobia bacterium]|nr:class A beta-lactamase-related serine hydrolase [Elusimicrobiota bacterium]